MKLFVIAKNGKMLKVGDDSVTAKWYFMTDAVIKYFATTVAVGDDVLIETATQNGNAYITKISKAGNSPSTVAISAPQTTVTQVETGVTPDVGVTTQKSGYLPRDQWEAKMKAEGKWKGGTGMSNDKGVDVNNSIKRQAIGHMTSRTLIGMQGIVTPDNVCELIEKIYNKYVDIVG
jgi:hypothetical protein